ncbi:MAG: glycosyltransferase family 2 protein [Candidatus Aureabacteria bacterium]|nr:glycosyltransferase family 2 protein [Candidatus Auribacterota bacterium]
MQKISVIVPVYYNEGSLPLLFDRLRGVRDRLLERKMGLELIFVDDGSGDGSLTELVKIKQQWEGVKVIKLTRNFGAVKASKVGSQFVTGDCFTILAADLQDPPELIIEMVERWQAGAKYVICCRNGRGDPVVSRIFAYIYYRLLRMLVSKDFPYGGYDVALMDRAMLPYIQQSGKTIHTPLFLYWLGFRPEILYYNRQKRIHGSSRWTFSKKYISSLDVLLGFSVTPIRLISLVGVMVSLASFGYGISVIIGAILGRTGVRGFAALATLICFLLGLVIIMLGVIGEYLWRVFEEVNKRPEAVVEKIY